MTSDVADRLRWKASLPRAPEACRRCRPVVAAADQPRRDRPAGNRRRRDPVSGEADGVVNAIIPELPEPGQSDGRAVDRPGPGARDRDIAQFRIEITKVRLDFPGLLRRIIEFG